MTGKRIISYAFPLVVVACASLWPSFSAMAGVGLQLVSGGSVAQPTGKWNDQFATGLRGQIGLAVILPHSPLKFRIAGSYSHYGLPDVAFGLPARTGSIAFTGGQLQIIWKPFSMLSIQPYISAGYGVYAVDFRYHDNRIVYDQDQDFTDDALEAGLGFEIPWGRATLLLETSYLHFASSNSFETLYYTTGVAYSIIR